MIITYHGDDYFKLQSGQYTVLIDPTNQRSFKGATLAIHTVRPPEVEASDELFWIDHQGEYEVRGISIQGATLGKDAAGEKTAYRIVFDEVVFGILGYCTKEPDPTIQELFQKCDVLILPGKGKPYLSIDAAAKFARQIEPSVIIPSLDGDFKAFLKEFGQEKAGTEEKFVFKKKELVPKAMAVHPLHA